MKAQKLKLTKMNVIGGIGRCSFIAVIRIFNNYLKTKVIAENIEEAECIIKNTISNKEYQIMNIYREK